MLRRRRGRGRRGAARRFGGLGLLRFAGGAAALVLGGIIAAGLAGIALLVLLVLGFAFATVGGVLLYALLVAGWLIYGVIRAQPTRPPAIAQRVASAQQVGTPTSEGARRVGASVLAILVGLVLTVFASITLGRLGMPRVADLLLPPLIGGVLGLGAHALLRRSLVSPDPGEWPPPREIRTQVSRIRRKASSLAKEASAAGGVFNDLNRHAGEMSRRAGDLADRVFELRRVAREVSRDFARAHTESAPGAEPDAAHARFEELLMRNRRSQERCLDQLERIERLLDLARLEISCPDHEGEERDPAEVARDFEHELEAARQALEEVHRQIQI